MEEQDPAASAFDEQRADVGGDGLDDADDDGGDDGGDGGAGGLEDVVSVEDDRVDAAELLEEHQAEPAHECHARRLIGYHAEDTGALSGRVVHLGTKSYIQTNFLI